MRVIANNGTFSSPQWKTNFVRHTRSEVDILKQAIVPLDLVQHDRDELVSNTCHIIRPLFNNSFDRLGSAITPRHG